jgi:hypothetical protein
MVFTAFFNSPIKSLTSLLVLTDNITLICNINRKVKSKNLVKDFIKLINFVEKRVWEFSNELVNLFRIEWGLSTKRVSKSGKL